MPSFDSLFNAFVTILVTIDPPGLAPLFLAVTRGMNREERQQVSVRASIIGFLVMALFAVAGASILSVFGITLPAFRVAGGFLLFFIGDGGAGLGVGAGPAGLHGTAGGHGE